MPASLSQFIGDIREKRRLREQEEMQKVIPYVEALEQSIQREEEQRQDLKQVNLQEKYLFGDTAPEITSDRMRELGGAIGVRAEQTRRYEDSKIQAILGEEDVTGLPLAEKQIKAEEVKTETKREYQRQITAIKEEKSLDKKLLEAGIKKDGLNFEQKQEAYRKYRETKLAPKPEKSTFRTINGNIFKYNTKTDEWDISLHRIGREKGKTKHEKELIGNYNANLKKLSKYPEEPVQLTKDGKNLTQEWDEWNKLQTELIDLTSQMESFELLEKPELQETVDKTTKRTYWGDLGITKGAWDTLTPKQQDDIKKKNSWMGN